MEYAIKATGLVKNYKDFTLDNVDVDIPKGYITGFIGANGAGKSTVIKLLTGVTKAHRGNITINGKSLSCLTDEEKEKIAVVFDDCRLPGLLTYTELEKVFSGIYKNWQGEKFLSACRRANLGVKTKIKDYSKGMKMKISFARATCHNRDILILDEPAAGLDPVAREEMADMLLDFVSDENHTVFVSSHIITDLEKICDYITFIDKGKILLSGEKDEIKDNYAIVKGDLSLIDPDKIISKHITDYSSRALVYKDDLPKGENFTVEQPTLEDIMVFYVRR